MNDKFSNGWKKEAVRVLVDDFGYQSGKLVDFGAEKLIVDAAKDKFYFFFIERYERSLFDLNERLLKASPFDLKEQNMLNRDDPGSFYSPGGIRVFFVLNGPRLESHWPEPDLEYRPTKTADDEPILQDPLAGRFKRIATNLNAYVIHPGQIIKNYSPSFNWMRFFGKDHFPELTALSTSPELSRIAQLDYERTERQLYFDYIGSQKWYRIRTAKKKAVGAYCERCGAEETPSFVLEVHHLNYVNFGDEHPDDLQVVCQNCHPLADMERAKAKAFETWLCKKLGREAEYLGFDDMDRYLEDFERWYHNTRN